MKPAIFEIDTKGWIKDSVKITLPNNECILITSKNKCIDVIFDISLVVGADVDDIRKYIAEKLAIDSEAMIIDNIMALIILYLWSFNRGVQS